MIKLNNISSLDFPLGLHDKIMRKVYFLKFRLPIFSLIIIALINLANSGWHLLTKTSEMGTLSIMQIMLQQFEFSFDYLKSLAQVTLENIPLTPMFSFALNLILVYYLIKIFKYFEKSNQALKKINI